MSISVSFHIEKLYIAENGTVLNLLLIGIIRGKIFLVVIGENGNDIFVIAVCILKKART